MCGILGFINNDRSFVKGAPVFQQMLLDGLKRGVDGTGVMLMDKKDNLHVQKSAMWSPDFICTQGYQRGIAPHVSDAKFAIGHNRAATKGSVSRDNAHPFQVEHITLVHNGYISNAWTLLPHGVNHDVDSYSAAYAIAHKGEKEGLEAIRGGFALVWYNAEDNTINMARNDARPLWLMFLADKDGNPLDSLLFMSEWENLFSIMSRNDLHFGSKFRLLPTQQHIKFKLGNLREFTRTPFAEPPIPHTYNTGGNYGNNGGTHYPGYGGWRPGNNNRQQADKEEPQKASDTAGKGSAKSTSDLEPSKEELERLEQLLQGISKKQRKAGGIPTSRKTIRHAYNRLKEKNYRLGQSCLLYCNEWIPYGNQRNTLGVVTASRKADANCMVEIHNVSQETFKLMKSRAGVYGVVVNYKTSKTGRDCLICVLDTDLQAFDEPPKKTTPEPTPVECCSDIAECSASGECLAERQSRELSYRRTEQPTLNGPGGSRLTLSKFLALTQQGCGHCVRPIDANAHTNVIWLGSDPICEDCASNPQIAQSLGLALPSNHTPKGVH